MKILSGKKKYVLLLVAVMIAAAGIYGYRAVLSPNTNFEKESVLFFIEASEDVNALAMRLNADNILADEGSFLQVAKLKKFSSAKPGRYRFKKGMNNNTMVNMLRSGNQEALSLRIDDVHNLNALAGKLGKNLQADSTAFINVFTDPKVCEAYGFTPYTIVCMFVPNTYDFFWTMTPGDFMKKMEPIYSSYWTTKNINKAHEVGLSTTDVSILASIVKAETAKRDEAPKIAGLYLNRLRIGMALQSDPTAVYGRQQHSQRVYLSDLENDSPYNTYLYTGLPPGPIDLVEPIYLDAVLNSARHDYIYMCAQAGGTGYHNFSKTLEQHNNYRREYTRWLESRGIH